MWSLSSFTSSFEEKQFNILLDELQKSFNCRFFFIASFTALRASLSHPQQCHYWYLTNCRITHPNMLYGFCLSFFFHAADEQEVTVAHLVQLPLVTATSSEQNTELTPTKTIWQGIYSVLQQFSFHNKHTTITSTHLGIVGFSRVAFRKRTENINGWGNPQNNQRSALDQVCALTGEDTHETRSVYGDTAEF